MIQNGQIKAKSTLHIPVQVPGLIEILTHTQTQDIVDVHSMIFKNTLFGTCTTVYAKKRTLYKFH